jgi:hypothetical protein
MILIIALCLTFFSEAVFAGGRTQVSPEATAESPSSDLYVEATEAGRTHEQPQPDRAERVIKALAAAYPQRIERAVFRNGDWAVFLENSWYYYAGGRMLPEELLYMADDYSPHAFYNYQKELPEWRRPSPEEAERLSSMASSRATARRKRSTHFFDALFRARSSDEAYQRIKTIRFLGKSVNVHYSILEDLSLVEERILLAARTDSGVQAWINSINNLEGWSWRNVADTQSRSFHAYGTAIDILPRTFEGRETYWLWAANKNLDWWNISYNGRYHPPDAVVKAFERFGFIWGGKWLFFDTMHFEYRPEVLILNGMPPAVIR